MSVSHIACRVCLALGLPGAIPLVAAEPPVIQTLELPAGVERSPYSVVLEASGEGPIDFEVVSGRQPWGLVLERDGRLHGTPSYADSFNFTVRARSPSGAARQSFTVTVAPWQVKTSLGCGDVVSVALSASARSPHTGLDVDRDGAAAYLRLPIDADVAGVQLKLSAATGDAILALPRTSAGTGAPEIYGYALVEDHPGDESMWLTDNSPYYSLATYRSDGRVPVTVLADVPGDYTLEVGCTYGVAVAEVGLPDAALGGDYAAQLTASLGVQPLSWSAQGLPAGLLLDAQTGALSGVATDAGDYTPEVTVVDAVGAVDTRAVALRVVEPTPVSCGDTVDGALEVRAFDGSRGLATSGGAAVYAVSLPEGVSRVAIEAQALDEGAGLGLWQGLPGSVGGSSAAAAQLKRRFDDLGPARLEVGAGGLPGLDDYGAELPFTVAALGAGTAYSLRITCDETPVVLPRALPHPTLAEAYTQQLRLRGGAQPGSFEVVGGGLPAGLSLSGDGALVGTPSAEGSFSFEVRGVSAAGEAYASYAGVVGQDACGDAQPLACGDFIYDTLSSPAWQSRVQLDLDTQGGARFYCLDVAASSSVDLELTGVSGGNPDVLLAGPGVSPGSAELADYVRWSALDGVDRLSLGPVGYPALGSYGGLPLGLAVVAREPGGYTLEVSCGR